MSKDTKELSVIEKNITDTVLSRVKEMEAGQDLHFPPNYSYQNALKSAYLILQETVDKNKVSVLQSCSRESIANALLDMVVQGLSPAKKQCYFVAYGGQLQLMRSYMGTVAVTKRLKGVKDVKAYCIYEGDEFETEFDVNTATIKITKFNPDFANIDITKIKGAFAVVVGEEGPLHTEIMSMKQIRSAWGQGAAKGNSGAHNNFAEEMAKKTVINRACKMYANTSDDSDLLIEAFNNATENEYKDEVTEEVKQNANVEVLDFDNAPKQAVDVEYKEVEEKKEPTQQKIGGVPF